jgi:hypothetical protein
MDNGKKIKSEFLFKGKECTMGQITTKILLQEK